MLPWPTSINVGLGSARIHQVTVHIVSAWHVVVHLVPCRLVSCNTIRFDACLAIYTIRFDVWEPIRYDENLTSGRLSNDQSIRLAAADANLL